MSCIEMENNGKIEGKNAKITIMREFVYQGRVVEITPTHHIIETHDGKVMEVANQKVVGVEIRSMKSYPSGA